MVPRNTVIQTLSSLVESRLIDVCSMLYDNIYDNIYTNIYDDIYDKIGCVLTCCVCCLYE